MWPGQSSVVLAFDNAVATCSLAGGVCTINFVAKAVDPHNSAQSQPQFAGRQPVSFSGFATVDSCVMSCCIATMWCTMYMQQFAAHHHVSVAVLLMVKACRMHLVW